MIGSFCYRFADEEHAAKMVATLDDDIQVVDWGPLMMPDGEDAEGNPQFRAKKGHLVFVLTPDPVPIENWDQWQYKPDFWPHTYADRWYEQVACEEWAGDTDERRTIEESVPEPIPKELREATKAAREARYLANQAILDLRIEVERQRDRLDGLNDQLDQLTDVRGKAATAIDELSVRLDAMRTERNDAVTVAQDKDADNKDRQAARARRDELTVEIDDVQASLDTQRTVRDNTAESIDRVRDERDAVRDDLDAKRVDLDAERAKRDAAKLEVIRLKK